MDFIRKYAGLLIAFAFFVGLFIGLVVLGWWLWPVEWTDATPNELSDNYQALYLNAIADAYAMTGNTEMVNQALGGWGGEIAACEIANNTQDPAQRARLEAIAQVMNPGGCAAITAEGGPEADSTTGFNISWPIVILFLLLVALIAAILYVLFRRQSTPSTTYDELEPVYEELPDTAQAAAAPALAPVERSSVGGEIPLARFPSTYTRGNDTYDESFTIENTNGEFLGECGVEIADRNSSGVTAFRVWLFDKRDVRTVSKVVMSDEAFYDDAIKAKLATQGEPALAREDETIVLETASLIINADVNEIIYGTDPNVQPQSYFDRFSVEISAWAKDGSTAESVTGTANQFDF